MYTHLKRRFVECCVHDFLYYFDLGELHVAFQIAPFLDGVYMKGEEGEREREGERRGG